MMDEESTPSLTAEDFLEALHSILCWWTSVELARHVYGQELGKMPETRQAYVFKKHRLFVRDYHGFYGQLDSGNRARFASALTQAAVEKRKMKLSKETE